MKFYKILITGPFNAGKSTLIKTLCGRVLDTDRRISSDERAVKERTTVALDFGLISPAPKVMVRLYGTPGQNRFHFMWRALSVGMHGYVFMVDSADPSRIPEAQRIYRFFRLSFPRTPHVVAANKFDLPNHMDLDELRGRIGLPPHVPILPTIALERDKALRLLRSLVELIDGGVLEVKEEGAGSSFKTRSG